MKTIIAAAMIVAVGVAGISLWHAAHNQRIDVSSSQIFIHGTPVCVFQHAGEIVASIGLCGTPGGESREGGTGKGGGVHGGTSTPLNPRLGLPPGHPPVDSPPDLQEERRILI